MMSYVEGIDKAQGTRPYASKGSPTIHRRPLVGVSIKSKDKVQISTLKCGLDA